jgi:hypothetical protein
VKKFLTFFCFVLPGSMLFAAEGEYAVSNIPAPLLREAHVVKRMELMRFEVLRNNEAVLKRKYALTILDEKGDDAAAFIEYYDSFHEIKNIEGVLYDAQGRELKRLKNRQVFDLSANEDNLADDNRGKFHHFHHNSYPYTVEYEVEIRYHGFLAFPTWLPRETENFSVVESQFQLVLPLDYPLRSRLFNTGEPEVLTIKNNREYRWKSGQLPAIENEYAAPAWVEVNPAVLIAPADFQIGKHRGNMESWQGLGMFYYALNQGRDQLPASIKETVHRITDGVADPLEKIFLLYKYLQQNTRYVSIQFGVGGWQAYDANYVAAKGYGDCKALVNYMYSLLKEAGIYSCYALVKAGKHFTPVVADFPSQQFNHVILAVPLKKDTVWLECTNQELSPGYLGEFTSDRDALLINENGGALVHTPVYGTQHNRQLREIRGVLNDDGILRFSVKSNYSGILQDDYHSMITQLSREKVRELLHNILDLPSYEIDSFHYTVSKGFIPSVKEFLQLTVYNYASLSGKRIFIVPNLLSKSPVKLNNDIRKWDIQTRLSYFEKDSVTIEIPAGYIPESVPADVSLNTQFGVYRSVVTIKGRIITFTRSLESFKGRFPAADYASFTQFKNAVYKADRSRLVLIKQ